MRPYLQGWLIWLTALLALLPVTVHQAQEVDSLDLDRIQRATVFVIQAGANNLETRCVGTGTIVRFDGLILTNAHNVVQSEACPGSELIIAMTVNPDEPPVPQYRAEIAQVDSGLDLALLRISRELDGREIEAGTLPVLPFVELADSATVNLDDTLTVIGYPDLGNSGTQQIRATATAFVAEPSGGEKSWFKLTAEEPIPGVMSGGGAYNQRGELVGIPTTAPVTVTEAVSRCLLLEDTNGDGFINNNDGCVPVGDFISVVRPANFAQPLIRSASLELQVEAVTAPLAIERVTEQPTIERMYFTTSVNNNLPTRVIGTAPAGTTSLYLFFDYRNFTAETVYEVRVSVDGVPNQTFSLPPVRWSGGTNGLWYIGSSGQPWPNGVYEFRVLVNGLVAQTREITVGGVSDDRPGFSNLVFGLLDSEGNLQGESYILPTGDIASARFIYRNMEAGIPWTAVWYFNGTPFSRSDDIWEADDGENGARDDVSIRPEGGLQPGNYRVDLFIGADPPRLSATGDFVVAGAPSGPLPEVFGNIRFFRAQSALADAEATPATSYPDGAHTIYARFDWAQITSGTLWTMEWLVDGTIFYRTTSPWNANNNGRDFSVQLTAPEGLPDGTYRVNMYINGVLLRTAEVSVGIGQLSINRLESIGGTRLRGQIVDGDTGEGIAGATFVLITEDYAVADFVWEDEQIFALATTDQNGRFEIDRPLALDTPYSVYIVAEEYLPVGQDGYSITQELLDEAGGSPIDILVPLTRD